MKDIFVGNLNTSTSESALRQLFAAFGPVKRGKDHDGHHRQVTRVRVCRNGQCGRRRVERVCVVFMGRRQYHLRLRRVPKKAIAALNGTLLDERALNVNEARPRKPPESFRDQHAHARGGGRRW